MSADIGLFHSLEMDDQTLLAEGWWIGAFNGDGAAEEVTGPYANEDLARRAMRNEARVLGSGPIGDWLLPVDLLPAGVKRLRFDGSKYVE